METTRGGKRKGAGRKPAENPKVRISLYVEKKKIWLFGNEKKLTAALTDFINKYGEEPEPKKEIVTRNQIQNEVRYEPLDEVIDFIVEAPDVPPPPVFKGNPFLHKVEMKKWHEKYGDKRHPRLRGNQNNGGF